MFYSIRNLYILWKIHPSVLQWESLIVKLIGMWRNSVWNLHTLQGNLPQGIEAMRLIQVSSLWQNKPSGVEYSDSRGVG